MIEKELKNSMNKWFFPGTAGSSGYGPDHSGLSKSGSSGSAREELQIHVSEDLANKIL